MEIKYLLIILSLILCFTDCVQPSSKKTVIFILDTHQIKNIKTVGVRGTDKPLNWDYSSELKSVKKDSLYTLTATFLTGYKFTEIKFTINDNFELKDKPNRRVCFDKKDTIIYKATFNKLN